MVLLSVSGKIEVSQFHLSTSFEAFASQSLFSSSKKELHKEHDLCWLDYPLVELISCTAVSRPAVS